MKRSEFVNSMKSIGGIIANVTEHSFSECMSEAYKLADMGYFGMSHEDFKLKNYQSDSKKRLDNIDSFYSYHVQAIEALVRKYDIVFIADEVYYPDTTTLASDLTCKNWKAIDCEYIKEGVYFSYESSNYIISTGNVVYLLTDNLTPFNSVVRQITEELLSQDRLDLLEINRIDKSTYNWFLSELGIAEISAEKIKFS